MIHEHPFRPEVLKWRDEAFDRKRKFFPPERRWLSFDRECPRCGGNVYWFKDETEDPNTPAVIDAVYDTSGLRADEEVTCGAVRKVTNKGCIAPLGVLEVPFTCKSGRVALANDLRKYFPDPYANRLSGLGSELGALRYMQEYAKLGYATGNVGNTGVYFQPAPDGLVMLQPDFEENDWADDPLAQQGIKIKPVHDIHTELWWFAIVDAADLPEGALDTYDREIGFYDLPEGEYVLRSNPRPEEGTRYATLTRKL